VKEDKVEHNKEAEQHKICIYFQYTCSQNTTNNMSYSITVYYTTICNIQLHVSAL
jgi:hypothetical protein